MKEKHIQLYITLCRQISEVSECTRRKFGSLIVDEVSNIIMASGYNGYLRGGSPLCGGDVCERETRCITSGTSLEVGCVHAEMNAIVNAARQGVAILGATIFVNGEPCILCAKLIVQAGLKRVVIIGDVYQTNGVSILRDRGIEVTYRKAEAVSVAS